MQENVLRLDIPMDNTTAMRVVECIRDVPRNLDRLVDPELRLAVQFVPQRLPFDVRHHVVQESVDFTRVE